MAQVFIYPANLRVADNEKLVVGAVLIPVHFSTAGGGPFETFVSRKEQSHLCRPETKRETRASKAPGRASPASERDQGSRVKVWPLEFVSQSRAIRIR